MKLCKTYLFIILLLPILSFGDDGLDSLLTQYSRQNDLSKKTISESIGHVSVLTREDIDALRLKTVVEVFNYVRFIPYGENFRGLPDPLSKRDTPLNESYVKVYIDDQAILSPYNGNAMQFFGKIKLNFIDHIEIYWGIPSFAFDEGTAYTVIKLYTKNPSRENINTINASLGSYGSYDINGYSAHSYEDFSYLLSIDHGKLNRKKYYKLQNYPLKRGLEDNYLYSKFSIKNSKITFSATKGTYENFLGNIAENYASLTSKTNETELKSAYLGYDFISDDETFKAYFGISHSKYTSTASGDPLIQLDVNETLYSYKNVIKDQLIDAKVSKEFTYKHNTLEFGLRGRYKRYWVPTNLFNNVGKKFYTYGYTKESSLSLYFEDRYLLSDKDLVVVSAKKNFYKRSGEADDSTGYGGRVGYIHNSPLWFLKLYMYHAKDPRDLYQFQNFKNYYDETLTSTNTAYSGEIGLREGDSALSLTYGLMRISRFSNSDPIKANNYSLSFSHKFNTYNRLKSALWYSDYKLGSNATAFEPERLRVQSAYMTLFSNFDGLTLANTLTYYRDSTYQNNRYIYDTTISYDCTKDLSFYLKGKNLFNDSPINTYVYYYDNNAIGSLETRLYDRTVWFGMECTF